jgi:DNA-binding transcriptional MocR family regulator
MLILDQSVYSIKGLTQQHLWIIVMSIAKRAGEGQKSFPSYQTIGSDCGVSRRTIIRQCNEMFELGIITKTKRYNKSEQTSNLYGFHPAFKSLGAMKFVGEEVEIGGDTHDTTPSDTSVTPPVTPMTLPSDTSVTLTASQVNYKSNEVIKKEKSFSAQKYIENLNENPELIQAMLDWLEIRKAKRTPTTQKAVDLGLKTLATLSSGNLNEKIKIINQTVERGWTGFFEIKQTTQNFSKPARKPAFFPTNNSTGRYDNIEQPF